MLLPMSIRKQQIVHLSIIVMLLGGVTVSLIDTDKFTLSAMTDNSRVNIVTDL